MRMRMLTRQAAWTCRRFAATSQPILRGAWRNLEPDETRALEALK
jgi:hypothetical protein